MTDEFTIDPGHTEELRPKVRRFPCEPPPVCLVHGVVMKSTSRWTQNESKKRTYRCPIPTCDESKELRQCWAYVDMESGEIIEFRSD